MNELWRIRLSIQLYLRSPEQNQSIVVFRAIRSSAPPGECSGDRYCGATYRMQRQLRTSFTVQCKLQYACSQKAFKFIFRHLHRVSSPWLRLQSKWPKATVQRWQRGHSKWPLTSLPLPFEYLWSRKITTHPWHSPKLIKDGTMALLEIWGEGWFVKFRPRYFRSEIFSHDHWQMYCAILKTLHVFLALLLFNFRLLIWMDIMMKLLKIWKNK